jgi:hypothetical protein
MYQNPEYFINPLGVWAKTDIEEILEDIDDDGKLSEDGWKKVSIISGAAFKLIGKAVETKVEWIPILGTLVGKLTDAKAMQEGAQELLEKSTAAKKWHYIELGLSKYGNKRVAQGQWDIEYEREMDRLNKDKPRWWPMSMKDREAREEANEDMGDIMYGFIDDLSTAGEKEGRSMLFLLPSSSYKGRAQKTLVGFP